MKKLIVVTAPRNRGKTTWLWELKSRLENSEGTVIGGFITELHGKGGEKNGFILVDQENGEKLVMASDNPPSGETGWVPFGKKYWFSESTFDKVYQLYSNAGKYTHLFMDEAGALELQGDGFAPSIRLLMKNYTGTLIIAVRDIFVEDFLSEFRFREDWEVEIDGPSAEI